MMWVFSFLAVAMSLVGATAIYVGMDPYRGSEGLALVLVGTFALCTGFLIAVLTFIAHRLGEIRALLATPASAPLDMPLAEETPAEAAAPEAVAVEEPEALPHAPPIPPLAPVRAPEKPVFDKPAADKPASDLPAPPDWLARGVAAGVGLAAGGAAFSALAEPAPAPEPPAEPAEPVDLPPLDSLKAPLEVFDSEPAMPAVPAEPAPVPRSDPGLEELLADVLAGARPADPTPETPEAAEPSAPAAPPVDDLERFLDAIPFAVEPPPGPPLPPLDDLLPPFPAPEPDWLATPAPSAPASDPEPAPMPAPANDEPVLLREGVIAGLPFRLFSNGQIISTIDGEDRAFESLKAFRAFVEGDAPSAE